MAANERLIIELGSGEAWAYPRGRDESCQRLKRFMSNLTLAEFTTVVGLLEEGLTHEEDRRRLREGMSSLQTLPSKVVRRVLTHPLWIYWVRSTGQIICAMNQRIPVAPQWRGHLPPHAFSAEDCLNCTSRMFSQLLLACHMVAGREIDVTIPAAEKRYLSLAGTGLSYDLERRLGSKHEQVKASVRKNSGQLFHLNLSRGADVIDRLYFSLNSESVEPVHGANQSVSNWLSVAKFSDGELEIDNRDECYLLNWVKGEVYPEGTRVDPVSDAAVPAWCEDVPRALDILGCCDPRLRAEITFVIRSLVPVQSNVPEHSVSCSNRDFFGAVQLSAHPGIALAEVLVHEYRHNILNAIIDVDPILDESNPKGAAFYSPWRKDLRPLSGLIHGIYSFMEVVGFYESYIDYYGSQAPQASLAEERIVTNSYRLTIAVNDFLRHAKLTRFGVELLEGVQRRVAQFEQDARNLNAVLWRTISNEIDQQRQSAH